MTDHLPSVGPVGDLPEAAVEAAARALFDLAGGDPERWPEAYLKAGWRGMGEAAVAAVLPILRSGIAAEDPEVESQFWRRHYWAAQDEAEANQ